MKDITTPTFLAIAGLTIVGAVILLLFFKAIPPENKDALNIAEGALLVWIGSIFQFYYGSTKTSQVKDQTISTMAATASTGTGSGGTTNIDKQTIVNTEGTTP